MKREIGVIVNCVLCDSYFVVVINVVDLSNYSGKKGKDLLLNSYEKQQQQLNPSHPIFLRCPHCLELIHSMSYSNWLQSDADCLLSVCRYLSFAENEGPALYLDHREDENKKPKWKLCQGIETFGCSIFSSSS
eukprot:TRINITY_DN5177_c0_g1_i2.p1 TRINITY_DN5177_c0_g1~~TRINITY_DN5177_c0_g1_i2.p1  ORF type:complete len:133 (+),score=23.75 TRINITY_DN5177_c0_g1_i2:123-521(+)